MLPALREKDRRATGLERSPHIVEDQGVACLVGYQRGVHMLDGRSLTVEVFRQPERSRAQDRAVFEGSSQGLRLGGCPVPHGPALHEDDRMMAVPARNGRRQPEHIPGLRAARHRLETHGGKVVALVDHKLPVVGDDAHQALDHADIDEAAWLALAAADLPDGGCGQIEECRELRDPLIHELQAVDQHERVGAARGDHGCRNHGLAEPGRCREDSGVVPQQRVVGHLLFVGQLAEEGGFNRIAGVAHILHIHMDAEILKHRLHCFEAASRQGDVVRQQFRAGHDAGDTEGRAPHRLRAVVFRILEGRDSDEPVDEAGREAGTRDVNLVAQHDFDPFGQCPGNVRKWQATRRWRRPGLLVPVFKWQAEADDPALSARFPRRLPRPRAWTGGAATRERPIGRGRARSRRQRTRCCRTFAGLLAEAVR